jgi:hypothetical protein
MVSTIATELFICSFCEQQMKITPAHVGRRIQCPKCTRAVFLYPNRDHVIDSLLSSIWYYQRPRLLFGSEEVGPITDTQFIQLIRAGQIESDFDIRSPELTRNEVIAAARINVAVIQERIDQRNAESQRRQKKDGRKQAVAANNMQRIMRGVATAVSDGQITFREREKLFEFARAAKIAESEVESLLQSESRRLLDALIEECLNDGILDPIEKQRIGDLAGGLGLTVELTPDQSRRLEICELASQIAHGIFAPPPLEIPDLSFSSGEVPLARATVEWHEVVKQKKPVGISLGDGHYLKLTGEGDCVLTNKRLVLVDKFTAKKVALSSIEIVRRYLDGVFCQRSTGKSVFIRLPQETYSDRFALLLEHAVTEQPVLGILPTEAFIPDEQFTFDIHFENQFYDEEPLGSALPPRYTFRVVGDHIGDRADWIDALRLGDHVHLVREPSNQYDENAVVVMDGGRRQLGYLKREVASWFGPMLDRGYSCYSQAYRKPSSGGLIVAVFQK